MNYPRQKKLPDGTLTTEFIEKCHCGRTRGPRGGVCWCGGAIPSLQEEARK